MDAKEARAITINPKREMSKGTEQDLRILFNDIKEQAEEGYTEFTVVYKMGDQTVLLIKHMEDLGYKVTMVPGKDWTLVKDTDGLLKRKPTKFKTYNITFSW